MTEEDDSVTGPAARELLIDQQLPRFEARTFSALVVDASAEQTYQAVRALDPDQVGQTAPFIQLMVRLRELPARLWLFHGSSGRTTRPAGGWVDLRDQYRQGRWSGHEL